MATYFQVVGDIFERGRLNNTVYFAQCISRDLAMGAGIALQFNKYFDTKNLALARWDVLGDYAKANIKCLRIGRVFNMITKEKYFNRPTLASIELALIGLASNINSVLLSGKEITEVRLPAIGCGLDRLNWGDVEPLLMKHVISKFEDQDIKFKVYFLKWEVNKHGIIQIKKEKGNV